MSLVFQKERVHQQEPQGGRYQGPECALGRVVWSPHDTGLGRHVRSCPEVDSQGQVGQG